MRLTRRRVLQSAGAAMAGALTASSSPAAQAPQASAQAIPLVPRVDLVNVLEYEEQARRVLSPTRFARIAGGDRSAFDRMTLRPRLMVPTTDLDLTLSLFGERLFAPIVVGPLAAPSVFHGDGDMAVVRGASAAQAPVIVSSLSAVSLGTLLAEAKVPVWYQVFASDPAAPAKVRAAVRAGVRAICVTVGASWSAGSARATPTSVSADLTRIAPLVRGAGVPVFVKGVVTVAAVQAALGLGVQGLVVSDHGGVARSPRGATVLDLRSVVSTVAGKVPVLADGAFRRGTDVIKALAFGATAVLIGRPVLWGLAAYGADGVQGVLETLQTELARCMCLSGRPRLDALSADMVRVHRA